MSFLKKVGLGNIIKIILVLVSFCLGVLVTLLFFEPNPLLIFIVILEMVILLGSVLLNIVLYLERRKMLDKEDIIADLAVSSSTREIANELQEPLNEARRILSNIPLTPEISRAVDHLDIMVNVVGNLVPKEESEEVQPFEFPDLTNKTILIVDDIDINRVILKETLDLTHAKVIEAENGEEAIQKFVDNEAKIDIILMDIRMPKINGYEATKRIRAKSEKGKNIPIIAITAHVFQEDVFKAFDSGMNDHLAKPIDINQLFLVLRKNLLN